MRPPKQTETGQQDLLRSRLDQIVNLKHPLVKLAQAIDWGFLEKELGAAYSDKPGRPPLPTRLMAGLAILKHMENLSDETLSARWLENPYYQLFCGEEFFQHEAPFDRSSIARWRLERSVDPTEVLQWLARSGPRLKRKSNGPAPICIYSNERFDVELRLSNEHAGAITDAGFAGALQVLRGAVLVTHFSFAAAGPPGDRIGFGACDQQTAVMLDPGDVLEVRPADILAMYELDPNNMCVLKGFPTALKSKTAFPFGVWFADANTLYVADEGNGDNTFSNGMYTVAAGQKTATGSRGGPPAHSSS